MDCRLVVLLCSKYKVMDIKNYVAAFDTSITYSVGDRVLINNIEFTGVDKKGQLVFVPSSDLDKNKHTG